MGFDNFTSGDEEQTQDNDPSGTHIYFYEQGHERLPEDDDVAEAQATAYELCRTQPTDGKVRSLANSGWDGGLMQMLAEYVISVGDFLEQEEATPMVENVLGDFSDEMQAEAIMSYLQDNPEVGQKIEQAIADEAAPAEADD